MEAVGRLLSVSLQFFGHVSRHRWIGLVWTDLDGEDWGATGAR